MRCWSRVRSKNDGCAGLSTHSFYPRDVVSAVYAGTLNTRGGRGKLAIFRRISPFISETVLDRPMVTMER